MDSLGDDPEGLGFDMPMLMNQQNQMFGSYGNEGSPMPSGLAGPSFQDDAMMGSTEDQNDAKRRRIARVSL